MNKQWYRYCISVRCQYPLILGYKWETTSLYIAICICVYCTFFPLDDKVPIIIIIYCMVKCKQTEDIIFYHVRLCIAHKLPMGPEKYSEMDYRITGLSIGSISNDWGFNSLFIAHFIFLPPSALADLTSQRLDIWMQPLSGHNNKSFQKLLEWHQLVLGPWPDIQLNFIEICWQAFETL